MARITLTTALIVLLNVSAGCNGADAGKGQLKPSRKNTPIIVKSVPILKIADAAEADIVEQMTANRLAYRQGLGLLVSHYIKTGNNMKLQWAEKELKALDKMPQYNYIIEAGVAGPKLKARKSITEADYMYQDGVRTEKRAGLLILIKSERLLRIALDRYNTLIKKHPTSDKIDDAAYRAAGIYEHFKDYSIALLYYQRAYQWDADTPHPVMYKAACILDEHLYRRDEAMKLYKKALDKGVLNKKQEKLAKKRIKYLSESGEAEKLD